MVTARDAFVAALAGAAGCVANLTPIFASRSGVTALVTAFSFPNAMAPLSKVIRGCSAP
jgi:hypothetical protein